MTREKLVDAAMGRNKLRKKDVACGDANTEGRGSGIKMKMPYTM